MMLFPHYHRMWAAIGVYSGGEDNAFFRRAGRGLVQSGGKVDRPGDVCLLGADVVHGVTNPTDAVRGRDPRVRRRLLRQPRSEWDPDTLIERPYDVARTLEYFEEQNARFAN